MKRNLNAILILVFLFLLVAGLNFVFFVEERGANENEENGNRSSYRASAYGTKAYYSLLEETGHPVTRFEKSFTELKAGDPASLVVISPPPNYALTEQELASLGTWVENGGLLVVIDREIRIPLGDANIETERTTSSQNVRIYQPTELTRGVERLSVTNGATRVRIHGRSVTEHIGDDQAALLAEVNIGKGRAIFLTDPHIVANNGIAERDNMILALNLVADRPNGRIAFDEFHHGYGVSFGAGGGLMAYFKGTPVPSMLWQAVLVGLLAVYTLGRRFARPVPLKRERRTTNLEFVSSLANVTRLARASDLAMQNIYTEFRKRLARVAGLPPGVESPRLAAAAARRANIPEREMRALMARCEAVAEGKPVSDPELLKLVVRIREIEAGLGI
jgi:hypothetical protein